MNPASKHTTLDPYAGGYAPWSIGLPHGFPKWTAAHPRIALASAFVSAILFAATVTVISSAAEGLLRLNSPLPQFGGMSLPASSSAHIAYRVAMEPGEVVLSLSQANEP